MANKSLPVAVMCWFPTKGEPIPVSLKYQDDNCEIHQIKNLSITAAKNVMQGKMFVCEAEVDNRITRFSLDFFSDDCRWMISFLSL